MKFLKKVSVSDNFKRSIHLKDDQSDLLVLENFICPASSANILETMYEHVALSSQCAFTWTGPYGSGKSSLAIFLSALARGKVDKESYSLATAKLKDVPASLLKIFSADQTRTVLPIVGSMKGPKEVFAEALGVAADGDEIITALQELSSQKDGVLLVVDEMGKFLEKVSHDASADIYLFQQIAELANRSKGKLIFVGILHQSFAEYARKLSRSARDEWIKIQGRFIDLSVNCAGEELLELVSRAILTEEKPTKKKTFTSVAKVIARNKPVEESILSETLQGAWPLHPAVTALLGPVSRKRFGQNQRSVFSFLSSAEVFGFQHFLKNEDYTKQSFYLPSMYWDYLQVNFENAIFASSDSKIWAVAVEAINKCSVTSKNPIIVEVMKTIALIDIFKGGSGLVASLEVLKTIFLDKETLENALVELVNLSLIKLSKYNQSYSLFEGSDFDIESELNEAFKNIASVDFVKLNQIASFKPIIAKRHYHETGAMRWMDISLVAEDYLLSKGRDSLQTHAFGEFGIVIPKNKTGKSKVLKFLKTNKSNSSFPRVYGVVDDFESLIDFSRELLALEWIEKNIASVAGDKIARREIENRRVVVSSLIENMLANSIRQLSWFFDGKELGSLNDQSLSRFSSDLADGVFCKAPLLKSEMLNRNKPSSNANAALNALLKRMVFNNGEERLGIDGFPSEGGLFKILLEDTGLYKKVKGRWEFVPPKQAENNLLELWQATDAFLIDTDENIHIREVYDFWSKPPFGIKKGLLPFIAASYILTKKGHVAVYLNDTYIPDVDDLFIDYLIKATSNIELRYVNNDKSKQALLKTLADGLTVSKDVRVFLTKEASPLEISRALVRVIDGLSPWVLKTRTLNRNTTRLRETLKAARDPNKLVFDDLPGIFPGQGQNEIAVEGVVNSLKELSEAYPLLIEKIGSALMKELEVGIPSPSNIQRLRERAKIVQQSTGDFRIDGLAARLIKFDETSDSIAQLAGLAANKPISDWIDQDVDRALIEIAVLCEGFRKAELYAHVKGRKPQRHAIALTSGLSGEKKVRQLSFDVLEDTKPTIEGIKRQIRGSVQDIDDPRLILAALAEMSSEYIELLEQAKREKDIA